MKIILITGSTGLVGSEAVRFFCKKGFTVVGLDNNMRKVFFGEDASTRWKLNELKCYSNYIHHNYDIRDTVIIENLFNEYNSDIELIIHTAAQPSHDWAIREPLTDFSVNLYSTVNLLEVARKYCSNAIFIFASTNKVYGDNPNRLPLIELETRWEISKTHKYFRGINETMSIDQTLHSLFGASKTSADIYVQEYYKYFGMKTVCFRAGCLSGSSHSGVQLHGFLSYLMKCTIRGVPYTIFGYKGKQVRDNMHSRDLVNAFYEFYRKPKAGEVYNIGGGRYSNCSILEAIKIIERITGKKVNYTYVEKPRIGDHIWWISDISKFQHHYPNWNLIYSIEDILVDIYENSEKKKDGSKKKKLSKEEVRLISTEDIYQKNK